MNLFGNIKNPLENDETLIKILEIYCNAKVDNGTKKIEDSDELYKRIIDYGKEKEEKQEKYANEFYKHIVLPNLNKLYENISQIDFESYDREVENLRAQIEAQPISISEKRDRISELYKKTMYPLSQFKILFRSFNSFEEIEKIYKDQELWNIEQILDDISLYPSLKEKKIKELQKLGLSDKKIENRKILIEFRKKMYNRFWRRNRSYGISCESTKFTIARYRCRETKRRNKILY